MATLGSLAGEINAQLGNRRDVLSYTTFPSVPNPQDTDRLMIWLKESYTEIAMGYRFEELGDTITDVMVPNIDTYALPNNATRFIRAVTLLFPVGNNQEPRPVRRRHIRNIRRYQTSSPGPPSIYAPIAPAGVSSIIVRPVPDLGYTFIWDIQLKPVITSPFANIIVKLPDDWISALKSLTKLKGHTGLAEPDKANAEQTYLFGGYDPAVGRRMPGIIKQLTAPRDQLDIEDSEWGMQPQVRRYTNTW